MKSKIKVFTFSPYNGELRINNVIVSKEQCIKELEAIQEPTKTDFNMAFQRLITYGFDIDKTLNYYSGQV